MSAAQHALGIDEVLRLVLGNIPPRSSECVWSADNPRWLHHWHPRPCFLPTAALVNKQWLEAALDYMWADIEAEELADNILRKRFLRRQNESGLRAQHTVLKHVQRFVRHAHRIRTLSIMEDMGDEDIYRAFTSCAPTELWKDMPKLRTLTLWVDGSPEQLEASRCFLSPTLSNICLRLPWSYYDVHRDAYSWSAEHAAFFADLRRAATSIRVFYLAIPVQPALWRVFEDPILSLLPQLPNLKAVYVPTFALSPTFVTRCAAGHDAIRIRSSDDCDYSEDEIFNVEDLPFYKSKEWGILEGQLTKTPPSLSELEGADPVDRCCPSELAVCSDVAGINQLIHLNLDVSLLTRLDIALVRAPSIDYLRDALRAIGRASSKLCEFRLTAPDASFDYPPGFLERDVARLDWRTLAPLTACTAMEVFIVYWDTSVLITEPEIEELACAWPRLRVLNLYAGRPHPSNPLEPSPSMAVLATLSLHCPLIKNLVMQLSPVMPDNVPGSGVRPFEHLKLPAILVGLPAPDDGPTLFATHMFLSQILPVRCHDPLYRIMRTREDPEVASPHNVDEWCDWVGAVSSFTRKLNGLWQERERIA